MTADEYSAEVYGTDYPTAREAAEGAAAVLAAEVQDYFEWEIAAVATEAYNVGVATAISGAASGFSHA